MELQQPKSVFISYKTEEFDDANWVRATLENNGISCWMAPMCIPGGSSYAVEIPNAIKQCTVFVLILSEKSQLSKWVPRELDQAINEGKTIMPFMLEDCALKDDFNFYLTNVQRYKAYESKVATMQKMITEIKAILEKQTPAPVPVQPAPAPVQPASAPVQPAPAPAKPAPAPVQPAPAPAQPAPAKKRKVGKIITLAVGAPVLALVLLIVLIVAVIIPANRVTIAGEKFSKRETYIHLQDVEITQSDVDALQELTKLSYLNLKDCTITATDLHNVCSGNMRNLEMQNCQLSKEQLQTIDFSAASLDSLNLSGNTAVDSLSMLGGELSVLYVDDTSLKSLDGIDAFAETLRTFSAANNELTDIKPLSACMQLQNLYLSNNQISTLVPLSACTELRKLDISGNQLKSLIGLEKALYLDQLNAGENQLNTIKGLDNTSKLSWVDLGNNEISDISLLSKSAATLQGLYIDHNNVSSVSALQSCEKLHTLQADYNRLTSVKELQNNTQLKNVSLGHNMLVSVEGLSDKPLKYLNVSNNRLSGAWDAAQLQFDADEKIVLDMSNNLLQTVSVQTDVKYSYLALQGNAITDLSFLCELEGDSLSFDYNANTDFAAMEDPDWYAYYIVNCPLDQQVSISEKFSSYRTKFVTAEQADILSEKTPSVLSGFTML